MLLSAQRSVLVVVDVQERLLPAVRDQERIVRNTGLLLRAARELAVPVLVSEQYPKGLGPTVASLKELVPDGAMVEKITFSCTGEPAFLDRLDDIGRDQLVLCGTEAHVCVLQTALGLAAAGRSVFLVADATGSRDPRNAELALARMRMNGVQVVSTEMVVFEWMERAGTPAFKALSALIK